MPYTNTGIKKDTREENGMLGGGVGIKKDTREERERPLSLRAVDANRLPMAVVARRKSRGYQRRYPRAKDKVLKPKA